MERLDGNIPEEKKNCVVSWFLLSTTLHQIKRCGCAPVTSRSQIESAKPYILCRHYYHINHVIMICGFKSRISYEISRYCRKNMSDQQWSEHSVQITFNSSCTIIFLLIAFSSRARMLPLNVYYIKCLLWVFNKVI